MVDSSFKVWTFRWSGKSPKAWSVWRNHDAVSGIRTSRRELFLEAVEAIRQLSTVTPYGRLGSTLRRNHLEFLLTDTVKISLVDSSETSSSAFV